MSNQKIGVLLVNLGTPTHPTKAAVREFLKAFLSDKRVVDLPRIIWYPILYGIILNFRPAKVAKNYQKIWTENGSPLMAISLKQKENLQLYFDANHKDNDYLVELAMTYGNPSIQSSLEKLAAQDASQIVVLPLYPQYSTTTTACVSDQIEQLDQSIQSKIKFINDYHINDDYIQALASSVGAPLAKDEKTCYVFSWHS